MQIQEILSPSYCYRSFRKRSFSTPVFVFIFYFSCHICLKIKSEKFSAVGTRGFDLNSNTGLLSRLPVSANLSREKHNVSFMWKQRTSTSNFRSESKFSTLYERTAYRTIQIPISSACSCARQCFTL